MKLQRFHSRSLSSVAVILIIAIAFLSYSQAISGESSRNFEEIEVNVPAVYDSAGEVFSIKVQLVSNGSLIIEGPRRVDNDTLLSIWSSLFISNLLSNSSRWQNGFKIIFPSNIESIGGPSASLAITLAMLKLLNRDSVNLLDNYSITGAVSLSGLTVAVGGIMVKYNATINKGLDGMVIPYSNLPSLEPEDAEKVLPVGSVLELYFMSLSSFPYALDTRGNMSFKYPPEIKEYLERVYTFFYNNTQPVNDVIAKYMELANRAYREGYNYAAASLSFFAYSQFISTLYDNYGPEELTVRYNELLRKARSLEDSLREIESERIRGTVIALYDIELLSLAESRLWLCQNLLKRYESSNFSEASLLAIAEARCLTAEMWLNASNIKFSEQIYLNTSMLLKALDDYLFYLDKMIKYVESLYAKVGPNESMLDSIRELEDLYAKITEVDGESALPLKLGLSIELAQNIENLLSSFNIMSESVETKYLEETYRTWAYVNSLVESLGINSVISNLYLEYSVFMSESNPVISLQLGSQAIIALYPYVMSVKLSEAVNELIISKKTSLFETTMIVSVITVSFLLICISLFKLISEPHSKDSISSVKEGQDEGNERHREDVLYAGNRPITS